MVGHWACESCIAASGLDVAGQASSPAPLNWCSVGGHTVAGTTRWAPAGGRRDASAAGPAQPILEPVQGSLF